MTSPRHKWWRLSLRELLGIFAFVALAFASLLNASQSWAMAVFGLTIVIVVVLAIVAAIERGARQAAAAGGLIAMLVYAGVWHQQPATTLGNKADPTFGLKTILLHEGYLPTTHALNALWFRVGGTYLIELETGRVVDKLSSEYPIYGGGGGGIAKSQIPSDWSGGTLVTRGFPVLENFLAVGHCLWAILLAYLGGKFAVWIYSRRVTREENIKEGTPT